MNISQKIVANGDKVGANSEARNSPYIVNILASNMTQGC